MMRAADQGRRAGRKCWHPIGAAQRSISSGNQSRDRLREQHKAKIHDVRECRAGDEQVANGAKKSVRIVSAKKIRGIEALVPAALKRRAVDNASRRVGGPIRTIRSAAR
jgi:hypothetical protein